MNATHARTSPYAPAHVDKNWPIKETSVINVPVQKVHATTYGSTCHSIRASAYPHAIAYRPRKTCMPYMPRNIGLGSNEDVRIPQHTGPEN